MDTTALAERLERSAGELRGDNARELIDLLREAAARLRAVAGEPVAWGVQCHSDGKLWMTDTSYDLAQRQAEDNDDTLVPLYTYPQPATPASGELSWIDRAARVAEEVLRGPLADVPANECVNGIQHVAWMAMKLAAKDVGSETKTCRWLGYLQGALVSLGYSTLETEKRRNLQSATPNPEQPARAKGGE